MESYRRTRGEERVQVSRAEATRWVDARSHAPMQRPGSLRRPVAMRPPSPADAATLWALVRDSGVLDLNSPYAYLLLCSDFADTCVVAESAGRAIGFVGAYRPPPRPDSVFVWQIVIDRSAQRQGLGAGLLECLLARPGCRGARFLEATVTPSNEPSRALFERFARRRGVPLLKAVAFGGELFPTADHEEEMRIRIGPLSTSESPPEER